ncbi:hypothetical protein N8A98_09595 [Devosia neptuniae]|uniref:Uncharacterized protein n=1 Tax=Devosia neptuniae TaxID=191302 RepID=A0ABY6CGP2_9HYPH|nr:hypothetical protein [Devosia neptuniae]UXN71407.1 hypothetical protein N8A98_09595 [Devosia neptuniae]
MARTLTSHGEIRQWAEARGGNPMLMETPDGTGSRTLLQLTFGQHAINTDGNEGPDRIGGFQLVSWDDWFAALDAAKLALRVSDDLAGGNEAEFEFVPREGGDNTSEAGKKPAAISIQSPNKDDRAS